MPEKWVSRITLHRYPKEIIEREYQSKQKSFRQVCSELVMNWRTLKKLLNYYWIPIRYWTEAVATQWIWEKWERRRLKDRANIKHRIITTDWYYEIRFDWEHKSLDRWRVKEHILVMEDLIWRRLEKWEVVHHKDGNKLNNLPSNLQLMTASDHNKLHRKEMQIGSHWQIIWKKSLSS